MDRDDIGGWEGETDVLVVGYGLSGGIAAIEARDLGAEVMILEKGEYPGGLSILSGGMVLCARNAEQAEKYLVATSAGRVGRDLAAAFAEELVENEEYLRRLAGPYNATLVDTKKHDPGDSGRTGHISLGYPFEGYETFYRAGVSHIPDFSGFPWVQKLAPPAVNLMKIVFGSVEDRAVKVALSTAAERLLSSEGTITGVVAQSRGRRVRLKARKAVILACGGFEQNEWLLKQYLQGVPFYSMASLTHTGDGVLMAQKAGAALWHMWHVHGSYGFKFDESPIAFRTTFAGSRNPNRIMPWIVVDRFGARYMNEYQPAPQDTGHRAMEIYDPDLPGYPRIPSYIVFDEAGRKRGPIAQPAALGSHMYEWSRDNSREIDRGWVVKATSIPELASRIRETKENGAWMDPRTLESTVHQWNGIVKRGEDALRRPPSTMMPVEVPPFYAVPVWPIINNTQGGPQHDARQRVVDPFGDPIPRLYAAGELGSFWSHLYLLAGNLGECVTSGRVAGRNAAAEPPLERGAS